MECIWNGDAVRFPLQLVDQDHVINVLFIVYRAGAVLRIYGIQFNITCTSRSLLCGFSCGRLWTIFHYCLLVSVKYCSICFNVRPRCLLLLSLLISSTVMTGCVNLLLDSGPGAVLNCLLPAQQSFVPMSSRILWSVHDSCEVVSWTAVTWQLRIVRPIESKYEAIYDFAIHIIANCNHNNTMCRHCKVLSVCYVPIDEMSCSNQPPVSCVVVLGLISKYIIIHVRYFWTLYSG